MFTVACYVFRVLDLSCLCLVFGFTGLLVFFGFALICLWACNFGCLWPVSLVLLFAWLRAWAGLCFDCSVMVWVDDCFGGCLDCVILRLIVLLCAVLFDVKCLVLY